MAASLAALPSMVIFSGTPWRRIALVRKRLAACSSRSCVRRKSIVCPILSTARERERHWPFTLMEVSSMRQLTQIALTPIQGVLEQRALLDGPPVDRGVIHVNPTFLHEFLDVACAQRV